MAAPTKVDEPGTGDLLANKLLDLADAADAVIVALGVEGTTAVDLAALKAAIVAATDATYA